jgi:hypothetical protein
MGIQIFCSLVKNSLNQDSLYRGATVIIIFVLFAKSNSTRGRHKKQLFSDFIQSYPNRYLF